MTTPIETLKPRADDARNLLSENSAYRHAIAECRKRWVNEMISAANWDRDKIADQLNLIRALEAVTKELQIEINDYEMAARRRQR